MSEFTAKRDLTKVNDAASKCEKREADVERETDQQDQQAPRTFNAAQC